MIERFFVLFSFPPSRCRLRLLTDPLCLLIGVSSACIFPVHFFLGNFSLCRAFYSPLTLKSSDGWPRLGVDIFLLLDTFSLFTVLSVVSHLCCTLPFSLFPVLSLRQSPWPEFLTTGFYVWSFFYFCPLH